MFRPPALLNGTRQGFFSKVFLNSFTYFLNFGQLNNSFSSKVQEKSKQKH